MDHCDLLYDIPNNYRQVLRNFYLSNIQRNEILLQEYADLCSIFNDCNVQVAPLKGIYLLQNLYSDLGSRLLGDIDLLVHYQDENEINRIMLDLGYSQGQYIITSKKL